MMVSSFFYGEIPIGQDPAGVRDKNLPL